MRQMQIADEIICYLETISQVKGCTLYGSLANRNADTYSDIDICVDVSGCDNGAFIENDNARAIELKENRKVIGMIKIYPDNNHGRYHAMMINYALSSAYWGQGYMTETVSRVMQYAFEELNIDLLTVFHYPQNVASRRVIEKCGFDYDGTIEQGCTRYDGQVFDAVCHSLLREDWVNQKS